jgi:hypothetical protein
MRRIVNIIQQNCGTDDILVNLYIKTYNYHPAQPGAVAGITI